MLRRLLFSLTAVFPMVGLLAAADEPNPAAKEDAAKKKQAESPEIAIPPAPAKGRIAIAGADSVKGDDPASYRIAYSADEAWAGKKVHVAVKQVIAVNRRIQEPVRLSIGTQSGTKTVTTYFPLTLQAQGRESIALPSCRSLGFDASANVNVLSNQSVLSSLELVIVASHEDAKPLSNPLAPQVGKIESERK